MVEILQKVNKNFSHSTLFRLDEPLFWVWGYSEGKMPAFLMQYTLCYKKRAYNVISSPNQHYTIYTQLNCQIQIILSM